MTVTTFGQPHFLLVKSLSKVSTYNPQYQISLFFFFKNFQIPLCCKVNNFGKNIFIGGTFVNYGSYLSRSQTIWSIKLCNDSPTSFWIPPFFVPQNTHDNKGQHGQNNRPPLLEMFKQKFFLGRRKYRTFFEIDINRY